MDRLSFGTLFASILLVSAPDPASAQRRPLPPVNERLVRVSDVVNALKCELAETFATGRYRNAFVQNNVMATILFKDAVARKSSAEAGFQLDFGVKVGPKGDASRQVASTQNLGISFEYQDAAEVRRVPPFCAKLAKNIKVQGDPFVALLNGIRAEHAQIEKGEPKVQLTQVSYATGFDIERATSVGGALNIIVVSFGASRENTRTAQQELTLTFDVGGLPPPPPPP